MFRTLTLILFLIAPISAHAIVIAGAHGSGGHISDGVVCSHTYVPVVIGHTYANPVPQSQDYGDIKAVVACHISESPIPPDVAIGCKDIDNPIQCYGIFCTDTYRTYDFKTWARMKTHRKNAHVVGINTYQHEIYVTW